MDLPNDRTWNMNPPSQHNVIVKFLSFRCASKNKIIIKAFLEFDIKAKLRSLGKILELDKNWNKNIFHPKFITKSLHLSTPSWSFTCVSPPRFPMHIIFIMYFMLLNSTIFAKSSEVQLIRYLKLLWCNKHTLF